jgi:hypothetical protein
MTDALRLPVALHIAGNGWHVIDLIFYAGASLLLIAGIALFMSGRRTRRDDT